MDEPPCISGSQSFSWEWIESTIDRTIQALEHIDCRELANIVNQWEAINTAVPLSPVLSECAARLRQKYLILAKLIAHSKTTSEILYRVAGCFRSN